MTFMAAVLPYLQVAGAVISAVGMLQQGEAAARQGEQAKAAADYNATISTQNAAIARQNAADKARQADRETYLRLGSIRANQGASGGSMEGSVLDVLGDVAAQSELERQHIIYSGEMQARGFTNDASLETFSGNAKLAAGKTTQSSSYWRAGSELLGGAVAYNRANTQLTRS